MNHQRQKNRKRVAFVVPAFPQLSETFLVNNFAGLLEKGWDVHVVCGQIQASNWDKFPHLRQNPQWKARIHRAWSHLPRWRELIQFPFAFAKCAIANFPGLLKYLNAGLKEFGLMAFHKLYLDAPLIVLNPDAIHFQFGSLAKNRMHLKQLLGSKIVTSFRGHDLNFFELDTPEFYADVWGQSDALHFMSNDLLARARNRGWKGSGTNSYVIPPSVDAAYFSPGPDRPVTSSVIGTLERPMRLVSVGRLAWAKGYEYGLQAVKNLLQQGIHCEYKIIGDGAHKQAVLFAIQELGLSKHVTLLYSQPPSEIKANLNWADVFLHAAVSEGFGVVVLEAQAMSLPVVCTDADGLSENVLDGQTGFVVPCRNAGALAEKLTMLAMNPDLRNKLGAAGRERVLKRFSIETEIDRYDVLLHTLFEGTQQTTKEKEAPDRTRVLAEN
jgi:colanic acid/amylovoran biosynthesis glycosyltransferase